MNQLEIALNYASKGIRVFPCNMDKKPLTKNGFKHATTDETQIRQWFKKHPNALIGSPNDQFVVIDIDSHGLCKAGSILTQTAISALEDAGIIHENSVKVTTMSGGTHVYFRKEEELTRKISALPNIDLCANNGYTILPDQKNYVAATDTPWDLLTDLEKLDLATLDVIIEDMTEVTRAAKQLKKENTSKDKSAGRRFKRAEKKSSTDDMRYIVTEDGVQYKQTNANDTYASSGKVYDNDPTENILNDEGKIRIEPYSIKSAETLMCIFHNQQIQKKLGAYLGLNVPNLNQTSQMSSIFPNHKDVRPSMGVRWREDNACLVIRDFANHHADCQNNLDFNITRIFVTLRQSSLAPRLADAEFNMHFLNLMYEAGMLDIDMFDYHEDINSLTGVNYKVAEGIRRLISFKRLFKDWDGYACLTQAFGAAFCNVSPRSVANAKKLLHEKGFIATHGYIRTNEKSQSTFYTTEALVMCTDYHITPPYFEELDQEIHAEKTKEYEEIGKLVMEERRQKFQERMEKQAEKERQKKIESGEIDPNAKPIRIVCGKKGKKTKKEDLNDRFVGKKFTTAVDLIGKRKAKSEETVEAVEESVETVKTNKLKDILTNVNVEKIRESIELATKSYYNEESLIEDKEDEMNFSNIGMIPARDIERYFKENKDKIPKNKVDLRECKDRSLCYVVNNSGKLKKLYVYKGKVYHEDRRRNLVEWNKSTIVNEPIHVGYIPAGSGWDVYDEEDEKEFWAGTTLVIILYDEHGNPIGKQFPNGVVEPYVAEQ